MAFSPAQERYFHELNKQKGIQPLPTQHQMPAQQLSMKSPPIPKPMQPVMPNQMYNPNRFANLRNKLKGPNTL